MFRILTEKTLMEEESVLSTQEAVEVAVDDVTSEVEIATGVGGAGGRLVPRLAIAWSLRTSLPRPPGRT